MLSKTKNYKWETVFPYCVVDLPCTKLSIAMCLDILFFTIYSLWCFEVIQSHFFHWILYSIVSKWRELSALYLNALANICFSYGTHCLIKFCIWVLQVEVMWSSGVKKLSPLFPLLVKGRNLYKLKTYRQVFSVHVVLSPLQLHWWEFKVWHANFVLPPRYGKMKLKELECFLKSTDVVQQQGLREQQGKRRKNVMQMDLRVDGGEFCVTLCSTLLHN